MRGSHDFLSEISGDFRQFSPWARCLHDIFSPHFHYFSLHLHHIYTTHFHYMKFSQYLFTTFSLRIFTIEGWTDRDEQTPWGCTDRFSIHIYTTNLHYTFSPQIFTTNFHYEFSPRNLHYRSSPWNLHYRFSPRIFTTNFDYEFSPWHLHYKFTPQL